MKFNNKKGFTLVELMAVIVILAAIISIAVPATISISHKVKVKMYNTKVEMILNSAKLYGQENSIPASTKENCSKNVTISELINNGYIKKDDVEKGIVENPIDGSSMNDYQVCLYKKNRRVYAKLVNCEEKWNKKYLDSNNNGNC